MESEDAVSALGALSQPTRLAAFRLLVGHEPGGLAAGDIAARLGVPANTLSAHLSILSRCGLVTAERKSRSIVYRARLERLSSLVLFLIKDCCGGRSDLCAPIVAELTPSC